MANDLILPLIAMNLAAAVAILAVMALREPIRALLGARITYGLWLIVPVAMLATWLPARTIVVPARAHLTLPVPAAIAQPVRALATGTTPMAIPIHVLPPPTGVTLDLAQISHIAFGLWLAGAVLCLIGLMIGQRRALARFGRLTADAEDPRLARSSNPSNGPALVGIVRPRVIVPSDFEQRFDAGEQAMILVHERTHMAGGDVLINALVAVLKALNWFNPLLYLGARYARVDQELACDAAVVGQFPKERQTYAQALLKTQLSSGPLPVGCYWPGRSKGLLEERIEMLAQDIPGPVRLIAGVTLVVALSCGAGLAAWSAEPPVVKTELAPASAGAAIPADSLANLGPDASAIFGVGKDASLLLNETDHGVMAPRTLKIGDEYRDGWKIVKLAARTATLTKGAQTRTVDLTGLPQVIATAQASSDTGKVLAAPVASQDELDTEAREAAIAAGDVTGLLLLPGRMPTDLARAEQAKGNISADIDPGQIKGSNIDGQGNITMGLPAQGPNGTEVVSRQVNSIGPNYLILQRDGTVWGPALQAAAEKAAWGGK